MKNFVYSGCGISNKHYHLDALQFVPITPAPYIFLIASKKRIFLPIFLEYNLFLLKSLRSTKMAPLTTHILYMFLNTNINQIEHEKLIFENLLIIQVQTFICSANNTSSPSSLSFLNTILFLLLICSILTTHTHFQI